MFDKNKHLKHKIDLLQYRAGQLTAADKAMETGDRAAYDAAMKQVSNYNEQIDAEEKLIAEYDKSFHGLDEDPKPGVVPGVVKSAVDGFQMLAKMLHRKSLTEVEKTALVTGPNSDNGTSYLVPDDVRAEIIEKRKSYVSARDLVDYMPTASVSGSVVYEDGVPTGLSDFDDGDAIPEEDALKMKIRKFTIGWKGKLIPVSVVLLRAAKATLMNYLQRWFVKNAVLTENKKIFAVLKSGYNDGKPLPVVGWRGLKKSIIKDLDPDCKIDGVIATNQSGYAALEDEVDANGRSILHPNPTDPSVMMFQNLPIKVFADAQLPNIDDTHFPMIYGCTKAGALFVEFEGLEFAVSEHVFFAKRQNCLRVTEGFDVISTDTDAYIYGSFEASPVPAEAAVGLEDDPEKDPV